MPIRVNANEFASKWNRRLKQSTQDISAGVDKVTESPGVKASKKQAKWISKMTDANTHKRWATNVASVSLDEWKSAIKDVGIPRIASGADKAQSKVSQFAEKLLAYQSANLTKIESMPDVTLEDAKNRMVAWFDVMSKFKK